MGLTQTPAHLAGALILCLTFVALFLADQTLNRVPPRITAWIQPEQTDHRDHEYDGAEQGGSCRRKSTFHQSGGSGPYL